MIQVRDDTDLAFWSSEFSATPLVLTPGIISKVFYQSLYRIWCCSRVLILLGMFFCVCGSLIPIPHPPLIYLARREYLLIKISNAVLFILWTFSTPVLFSPIAHVLLILSIVRIRWGITIIKTIIIDRYCHGRHGWWTPPCHVSNQTKIDCL